LPRNVSIVLGKTFGLIIYYVFPIRKKVALKNIKENFTELNNKQHIKILKNTYIHFGVIFSEFIRQQTLNEKNINAIINIDKKIIEKLNKNKGSIIMTGHLGNWEYFLPLFGLNNIKFSIVAQRIRNVYLNNLFLKIRSFKNVEIIFKNEGKDKMIQALKNNYHLGLASDQNAGKKGARVKFLNYEISIPKGAAIFHIKTKKPIFIGYCIMKKNYTYEFKLELLDTSNIDFEKQDAIKEINRKFTKSLEKMIIKYPNQYFWFHRMKNKTEYKK
tara:strand:- start:465 stop:1283 length:819 start_codon:yes stop_codon:yes gene_type:complete